MIIDRHGHRTAAPRPREAGSVTATVGGGDATRAAPEIVPNWMRAEARPCASVVSTSLVAKEPLPGGATEIMCSADRLVSGDPTASKRTDTPARGVPSIVLTAMTSDAASVTCTVSATFAPEAMLSCAGSGSGDGLVASAPPHDAHMATSSGTIVRGMRFLMTDLIYRMM